MAEGDFVLLEPTESELNAMHTHLSALNADSQGVTLNRFRAFYPKIGRGHLLNRLLKLKEQGRARSELRSSGAGVQFEYWFQVEV